MNGTIFITRINNTVCIPDTYKFRKSDQHFLPQNPTIANRIILPDNITRLYDSLFLSRLRDVYINSLKNEWPDNWFNSLV